MTATQVSVVPTADYEIDDAHTRIGFAARYAMITTVRGEFTEFSGRAFLDGEDPLRSSVSLTIWTASINTRQAQRDEHLRSPDFLDVETYPEMLFHSTAVEATGADSYLVTGDLTICGITRQVPVDFTFSGIGSDQPGSLLAAFEGTAVINRSDFGLTWNTVLETGGLLVGDEITLQLEVSAIRVPPGEG